MNPVSLLPKTYKLKVMKKNFILSLALFGIAMLFTTQQMSGVTLRPVGGKTEKTKNLEARATKAETWEFYSAIEEPSAEELAGFTSRHKLGKKVAYLYDSFKDTYVVKEEVVPGDPTRRTVIRKPEIYNAVRTIEKGLNRDIKKNGLPQDKAEAAFANVLKVALAAIDSDTESFEAALQEHKKNSSQLLAIFQRVNLQNLY